MSAINDPIGFKIEDILIRVIPGSVFIFSILVIIVERSIFPDLVPSYSTTVIAIGILFSFIFGELIELLRHSFFHTPKVFSRMVFRESGDHTHLRASDRFRLWIFDRLSTQDVYQTKNFSLNYRNKIAHSWWMDNPEFYIERKNNSSVNYELSGGNTLLRQKYTPKHLYPHHYLEEKNISVISKLAESNPLPGDKYNPRHLYYHLTKEVEPSLNKDAKRRRIQLRFYTNLKIGIVPALLYIIYIGSQEYSDFLISYIVVVFILLFFLYPLTIFFLNIILRSIERSHIKDLIKEYSYQKEIQ